MKLLIINGESQQDAIQMRSKRSVQAAIKAPVIIFRKIFLSGCYECLHAQWPLINSVSFAVLMSYNSLKARLPLQQVSAERCIPRVLSWTKAYICVRVCVHRRVFVFPYFDGGVMFLLLKQKPDHFSEQRPIRQFTPFLHTKHVSKRKNDSN